MNKVLVLAEQANGLLKSATRSAITAAKALGEVHVLVAGYQCQSVAEQAAQIDGVAEVFLAEDICFEHALPEAIAPLVLSLADAYSHLLAAATSAGKNIMPRVAASLDVTQISEVMGILDAQTFQRPVYAGNAIATVENLDDKKVLTVRPTNFEPAENAEVPVEIKPLTVKINNELSKFVHLTSEDSERPDLSSAEVVISGGRGLKNKATFDRLEKIANKMGAAIGASRAAVDAGLAPNDWQVGQTGQIVAPKLYIAVGISGAIQHIAGMKDSKLVVAINKDADAPIFDVADYGLVADLNDILPEWENQLSD